MNVRMSYVFIKEPTYLLTYAPKYQVLRGLLEELGY